VTYNRYISKKELKLLLTKKKLGVAFFSILCPFSVKKKYPKIISDYKNANIKTT